LNRNGFTLVELLIVIVIVGVLAAIAVLKMGGARERTYVASMKSDLRNLVVAENAYFNEAFEYTKSVSCGKPAPAGAIAFCTTPGNTLGKVTLVKPKAANAKGKGGKEAGWTVDITNAHSATRCAIYGGVVTPAAPATAATPEDVPACK
jgi:prepilin-type N-terminal cleavage/methylation domain-containing protein